MFITIYASGMKFDGGTIPEGKSLGGSESAAYYMAKKLALLGHKVTVFTSKESAGTWDGVKYEFIGNVTNETPLGDRFHFFCKAPMDICIIQRHPLAFSFPVNSKLNIWWLHDLALKRSKPYIERGLANIDMVFTVSEFHKKQVAEVYGIDEKFIYATQNGMDYGAIDDQPGFDARREKMVLFCSRPERGLKELVDGDSSLAALLPDYKFVVCGYDNTTPEMVGYYQHLYGCCNARENVGLAGHLSKEQLWKVMREVKAVVYPTMFEDTSNMVAIESAANGTPFIGVENAALPETCAAGFAHLVPVRNGSFSIKNFAQKVREICENKSTWEKFHEKALSNKQSWQVIAYDWNRLFETSIQCKSVADHRRLLKHYEHNSDIMAMLDYAATQDEKPAAFIDQYLPDFSGNYRFLLNRDFENHYDAYYKYEKDRGVVYGPEVLDGNARFECIFDIVRNCNPAKVLDYGCAHGHYTVNYAKRLPSVNFLGVDINESNIKAACKWAFEDKVENAGFLLGVHTNIPEGNLFDVIIVAEVLEHVENPAEVVQYLHDNHLADGGRIIISTPYGPWEAIGYKEHKGWRAHIHHFERQDILDLYENFVDFKNTALPFSDTLGHYVYSFTKSPDIKVGEIDYERKHRTQAPRETISLCMIVKDAEETIGRCLREVGPYVDEIVIAIDEKTDDATYARIDRLVDDYPISIVVDAESPLEIGFDAARNATIEKATCDWILWLDDDELFENAERIHRFLRNNQYNAYMTPQHHFAVEPPALIQTDLPCRIFRNRKGIRFFGFVHEHPCMNDDYNFGIVPALIINDFGISHNGYATEAKRRKRWTRNYPLLQKDRDLYPNRILGKYLYMRDIAHDIRYRREQLRGGVDDACIELAKKGVGLFDELIKEKATHAHYLINGLPYYSECVALAFNGKSIPFEFSISNNPVRGIFHDKDVLFRLFNKFVEESIEPITGKYV